MTATDENQAWDSATWEGSRRAMLRDVQAMTVRQRIELMFECAQRADRIATAAGNSNRHTEPR